jgi:hypothetical protein
MTTRQRRCLGSAEISLPLSDPVLPKPGTVPDNLLCNLPGFSLDVFFHCGEAALQPARLCGGLAGLLVPHAAWASTAEVVGFFAEPFIGCSLLPVGLCLLLWVRFRRWPAVVLPRVVGCLLLAASWDGVAIACWLRPATVGTGLRWYGACPELWGPKLLLLLFVVGWYGRRQLLELRGPSLAK